MEPKIKHRIIGIIILIAVIIIVFPLLFHKSNSLPTAAELSVSIPPEPAAPKVQVQLPQGLSSTAMPSTAASVQTGTSQPAASNTAENTVSAMTLTPAAELSSASAVKATTAHGQSTQQIQPMTAGQSAVPVKKTLAQPLPSVTRQNVAPTIPAKKIAAPKKSVQPMTISQPMMSPTAKTQPAASQTVSTQSSTAVSVSSSLPMKNIVVDYSKAWVIQVGVFSDSDHAEQLLQILRKEGFGSYTQTIHTQEGKILTKVFVGPNMSKKTIETMLQTLKSKYHLNGIVTHYQMP